MARWLGHMSHWLTQLGDKDYTLEELGPQGEPVEVEEAVRLLRRKMDDALPSEYLQAVRQRLQQKDTVSDIHWTNLVFELKRYLVLAALLSSVPRISPVIDEMWRAMRLEPGQYAALQSRFMPLNDAVGQTPKMDHADRAFFDVAYVSLFEATPFSRKLWGDFLRFPLSIEIIRRCREERDALVDAPFSASCSDDEALRSLAGVIGKGVSQAEVEVRAHVKALGADPEVFRQRFDGKPETMWGDRALLVRIAVFRSLLPYFYGRSEGKRRHHPDLSLYSQMNI